MNTSGSSFIPLYATSKCKCGPVDPPVDPAYPITSPALTFPDLPGFIKCIYVVVKPSP